MRQVCTMGVFAGAAIMLFNIIYYHNSLVELQHTAYSKKMFSRKEYVLCSVLMAFFFIGYIFIGHIFIQRKVPLASDLIIALVFFFGAIFATVVLKVQRTMNEAVKEKTDEIVKMLVNAMEAKDKYTSGHSLHVANLVELFYNKLPLNLQSKIKKPHLMDAAILHDIGKIGLPDNVLKKEECLTQEEWALVYTHPEMGEKILANTNFEGVGTIIKMHHERVDGKGYYKTPASEVPIESKMISIADAFSALYTDRVYSVSKPYEETMKILVEAAGTQFDSKLVSIFSDIPEEEIDACSKGVFAKSKTVWAKTFASFFCAKQRY